MHHILSILAFMAITLLIQGLSHFVIAKPHFDGVSFVRTRPIMLPSLGVMALQGAIMSLVLSAWRGADAVLLDGVIVATAFGLFLVAYIAVVEATKYDVPSIPAWVRVEATAGVVQFAVYGALLGVIHQQLA